MKYEILKKQLLSGRKVLEEFDKNKLEFAIARSLIKARIEAKMTQIELAKKMRTSQTQVARMESGEHLPLMQSMFRYAKAINKEINLTVTPQ